MNGKKSREFRKLLGYDLKAERKNGRQYIQVPCRKSPVMDGKVFLYTMIRVKDMKRVRYQLYKKFYTALEGDLK